MAGTENLLLLLLLVAAFYLLILRPQRARAKAVQEVRANLVVGADVLTTAGMYARVAAVDDEDGTVLLEIAPGVTARHLKAAVARVIRPAVVAGVGPEETGAAGAPGAHPVERAGDTDPEADGGSGGTSEPPG